jgi:azurin
MRSFRLLFLAAATLFLMPVSAWAKTCELSIEGNDQMQFNKSELVVGADCDKVKLTLEHTGDLGAQQMGHNWVLTQTADYQDVANKGMSAGAGTDYVAPGDDRVLASTEVIGGGSTTSVTFDAATLESGGDYTYFCSFPGHSAAMKGKLVVK